MVQQSQEVRTKDDDGYDEDLQQYDGTMRKRTPAQILAEAEATVARDKMAHPDRAVVRIERGPPVKGEMVAINIFRCPQHPDQQIRTQHSVSALWQLQAMCPQCNAKAAKLERIQVLGLASEFSVRYTLCHTRDVSYDHQGIAYAVPEKDTWHIYRTPVSVRREHSIRVGPWSLGWGPLLVTALLDAGDMQTMGSENPLAEDPAERFEGTMILQKTLIVGGREHAWEYLQDDPEPAYDPDEHTAGRTVFPYHKDLAQKPRKPAVQQNLGLPGA